MHDRGHEGRSLFHTDRIQRLIPGWPLSSDRHRGRRECFQLTFPLDLERDRLAFAFADDIQQLCFR